MASDPFFQTLEKLEPLLRAGDLAACESEAIATLRSLPKSPFHIAGNLEIVNDPADAAHFFDEFFTQQSERFPAAAVYTEMNGFDINPDLWYCDVFAYEADGGLNDLDWLCYWSSKDYPTYTILGLEALQFVYASDAFHDEQFRDASYLSSIVVVTKFQHFIQRATSFMRKLRVPLYATAHDFDFLARFPPLTHRTS